MMISFKIISSNLQLNEFLIDSNNYDKLCTEFHDLIRRDNISCIEVKKFFQLNGRDLNFSLHQLLDTLDPKDKFAPLHIAVNIAVKKGDYSIVKLFWIMVQTQILNVESDLVNGILVLHLFIY